MGSHVEYADAYLEAKERANASGREVGLEKIRGYAGTYYVVRALPNPEHRFGPDLRCEVVAPTK